MPERGIGVLYGKKHHLEDLPPYQTGGGMIEKVSFPKQHMQNSLINSKPARGILLQPLVLVKLLIISLILALEISKHMKRNCSNMHLNN